MTDILAKAMADRAHELMGVYTDIIYQPWDLSSGNVKQFWRELVTAATAEAARQPDVVEAEPEAMVEALADLDASAQLAAETVADLDDAAALLSATAAEIESPAESDAPEVAAEPSVIVDPAPAPKKAAKAKARKG